jgi:hypothetical protein
MSREVGLELARGVILNFRINHCGRGCYFGWIDTLTPGNDQNLLFGKLENRCIENSLPIKLKDASIWLATLGSGMPIMHEKLTNGKEICHVDENLCS